jgi:hypothetical protein
MPLTRSFFVIVHSDGAISGRGGVKVKSLTGFAGGAYDDPRRRAPAD